MGRCERIFNEVVTKLQNNVENHGVVVRNPSQKYRKDGDMGLEAHQVEVDIITQAVIDNGGSIDQYKFDELFRERFTVMPQDDDCYILNGMYPWLHLAQIMCGEGDLVAEEHGGVVVYRLPEDQR